NLRPGSIPTRQKNRRAHSIEACRPLRDSWRGVTRVSDDFGLPADLPLAGDESQRAPEVDAAERLIELVEEHTLQVLNGKLLPFPIACFRCAKQDLDQSFVRILIEGTIRACKKHLAQCATDVRDFGLPSSIRRLGLGDANNPLHQELVGALQPILEL